MIYSKVGKISRALCLDMPLGAGEHFDMIGKNSVRVAVVMPRKIYGIAEDIARIESLTFSTWARRVIERELVHSVGAVEVEKARREADRKKSIASHGGGTV